MTLELKTPVKQTKSNESVEYKFPGGMQKGESIVGTFKGITEKDFPKAPYYNGPVEGYVFENGEKSTILFGGKSLSYAMNDANVGDVVKVTYKQTVNKKGEKGTYKFHEYTVEVANI